MKKTTNTSAAPNPEWLFGGNPGAIEQQEKQGQTELVSNSQLPRDMRNPNVDNPTEQYAKMGIQILTPSKGDELFFGAILPAGWHKRATSHDMWSELVDDKGRVRANIFYKAAFYDRKSFINITPRYRWHQITLEHTRGEHWPCQIGVMDNATGKLLMNSQATTSDEEEQDFNRAAYAYLKEHYPDHEDVNAYWDDGSDCQSS